MRQRASLRGADGDTSRAVPSHCDPADRPGVARTLARHLGEAAPALRGALWLQADICRADLAVEIEAQGEATR